ncbi:hypothetical protein [Actinokineospora sp. NBRC 105648]|uniref:hypothetical protein n=1 Tax=Actinokineospora sp. NBRC 105648 TaxID=3032206 RepID=UPI0024A49A53|nr:hypothetical protein [Actinokineospora sp. NBRC 105648]GLZ40290.1 hypothetical protein Acsp05_39140 [Actinokineospora sp. NBRC 105648]
MPVNTVRAGLDGLIYRFDIVVLRQDTPLDRRDLAALAEHARVGIVIDWANSAFAADQDEDADEMRFHCDGAPWQAYRGIADDTRITDDSRDIIGYLNFTISKPGGSTFTTCLATLARRRSGRWSTRSSNWRRPGCCAGVPTPSSPKWLRRRTSSPTRSRPVHHSPLPGGAIFRPGG